MSAVRYNIFYGIWHLRNRIARINLEATETIRIGIFSRRRTSSSLLLKLPSYCNSTCIVSTCVVTSLSVSMCKMQIRRHIIASSRNYKRSTATTTNGHGCGDMLQSSISHNFHSHVAAWFNKSSLRLSILPPPSPFCTKKCYESIMQKECTYKFPFAADNI